MIRRKSHSADFPGRQRQPECWTCCGMSYRVKGIVCKGKIKYDTLPSCDRYASSIDDMWMTEKFPCKRRYAEQEDLEIPFPELRSSMGRLGE
jgi:hypothetical protein